MGKYIDILITDVQLHVSQSRKPQPVKRVIEKSIRSKQEYRAYTANTQMIGDDLRFIFQDPGIEQMREKAHAEGKELRIFIPNDGIPVYLGQDAEEFSKSKRWQEHMKKPETQQFFRDYNLKT